MRTYCLPMFLTTVLYIAPTLAAQADDSHTIRITAIERAPQLDGLLEEEFWSEIRPVDNFIQREPDEGSPASEHTEFYLAFTENALYIGVKAYDRNPQALAATYFERDSFLFDNDSIMVIIDSNADHRTAFAFETNPNGARTDLQFVEGEPANIDYDPVWDVAARRTDEGWAAEIKIPFFALSFTPSEEVEMRLLLRRLIRRKNEEVYWPAISRDYNVSSVSQYGTLIGLKNISPASDIEVKPSVITGLEQEGGADAAGELDLSADAKWDISTNLTADVTVNTDFAQVESDQLQVNLTRFSLFFPEKRDFFLESPDKFTFGPGNARVFFSRRIGLRDGRAVPILGGARLYGLVGDTNIGLLQMQTDSALGVDGEQFSVARVKHNILDRSSIGAIYTRRSGVRQDEDTTVGADVNYVFGTNHSAYLQMARSNRPGVESGNWMLHTGFSYFTEPLRFNLFYQDIGENFAPGIGFVPRRDQRHLRADVFYLPRPDLPMLRRFLFLARYDRIENHSGIVESELGLTVMEYQMDSGDRFWFVTEPTRENLPFSFEVVPGVEIPQADYSFTRYNTGFEMSGHRRFKAGGNIIWGDFFGGELMQYFGDLQWKALDRLHFGLNANLNHGDLPGGSFENDVYRFNIDYFFSPDLSTRVITQYRTLNENLVLNFRLRWQFRPGSEAWLVYDDIRDLDLPGDTLQQRALIAKVVYNFNL